MEKNYKKFVSQVKGLNEMFVESIKKKSDEISLKMSDWRYSPKGKQELVEKIFDDMQAICDNMTNVFKEAVKRFLSEYDIKLPADGKDHSTDIENAFRVIELLGYNLDERNLNNILEPLKGDYKSLKTVIDVIRVKSENAGAQRYSYELMKAIDGYNGVNGVVSDYLDMIGNIEEILDSEIGYRYEASQVSNSPLITVRDLIPYAYMACGDWMTEAGEAYEVLTHEFDSLFEAKNPTGRQMIKDAITG